MEIIVVNILSVNKEYQRPKGTAILRVREFLKTYKEDLEIKLKRKLKNKILWTTTRPDAFERILNEKGKDKIAKPFNRTIMEILLC